MLFQDFLILLIHVCLESILISLTDFVISGHRIKW